MESIVRLKVGETYAGMRVDVFVSTKIDSYSVFIQGLIKEGRVTVDEKR